MANITLINSTSIKDQQIANNRQTIGFDTGPGNALIDHWALNKYNLPFDKNGQIAASGTVNEGLLAIMLSDPYFKKAAPKSTGREYFNEHWLEKQLTLVNDKIDKNEQIKLTNEDIMATLVQFTAQSICNDLKLYTNQNADNTIEECHTLWSFGGGCRNHTLMNAIQILLPNWQIKDTIELGIESDFMEAIAFAWLAYCRVNLLPSTLPSVTGATRAAISGTVTSPPDLIG
ncbi:anhydro-N-acetylmuramic acid kinase [Psychrosphaera aquimarina]|uniref:Anhydro-N-acetylmuramic acid kinase n=1 Tax=Psychrosphaera aquimarina TaxID=2044854 RepID=A0ABU3R0L1_9GAMM|nr:anhydro-N-acetylmuramic acid kinase [Psychrosphaera aquimarina]MDU0113215.1 anhydro-N-acetylmuramic acid kinase [Psychrosphaera aquimarina]